MTRFLTCLLPVELHLHLHQTIDILKVVHTIKLLLCITIQIDDNTKITSLALWHVLPQPNKIPEQFEFEPCAVPLSVQR